MLKFFFLLWPFGVIFPLFASEYSLEYLEEMGPPKPDLVGTFIFDHPHFIIPHELFIQDKLNQFSQEEKKELANFSARVLTQKNILLQIHIDNFSNGEDILKGLSTPLMDRYLLILISPKQRIIQLHSSSAISQEYDENGRRELIALMRDNLSRGFFFEALKDLASHLAPYDKNLGHQILEKARPTTLPNEIISIAETHHSLPVNPFPILDTYKEKVMPIYPYFFLFPLPLFLVFFLRSSARRYIIYSLNSEKGQKKKLAFHFPISEKLPSGGISWAHLKQNKKVIKK